MGKKVAPTKRIRGMDEFEYWIEVERGWWNKTINHLVQMVLRNKSWEQSIPGIPKHPDENPLSAEKLQSLKHEYAKIVEEHKHRPLQDPVIEAATEVFYNTLMGKSTSPKLKRLHRIGQMPELGEGRAGDHIWTHPKVQDLPPFQLNILRILHGKAPKVFTTLELEMQVFQGLSEGDNLKFLLNQLDELRKAKLIARVTTNFAAGPYGHAWHFNWKFFQTIKSKLTPTQVQGFRDLRGKYQNPPPKGVDPEAIIHKTCCKPKKAKKGKR